MSITGSGAHGIIATMPLYAVYKINNYTDEQLLRATALSYLVCMYIKEYSGKLSAFCGCAIAAGTGMACALAWLKGLIIDKLGIKMQSGLVGDLVFPTLAAVEATIQGENVAVTDTELNIDKIKASPKRVSISIPVSKRAINQTNYSLQDVVLKQISLGVARTLNKWMFSGTALSGARNGVFVKTKPDVEYTNALTFADIVSLESTVMDAGVDVTDGTAAYVCTPKVYGALKSTPKAAGAAEMICQNGMVNGYPVLVTNYMDADSIGFGVFSNAAIGQFGDMDLVIDPYTGAKSNIVNFVLNTDYDIVVARPEAFAIAKKKASA